LPHRAGMRGKSLEGPVGTNELGPLGLVRLRKGDPLTKQTLEIAAGSSGWLPGAYP
jgi:hypothetical protein